MKRVLVTGATGFIGGHLVEALIGQGVETRCLVRPTSDTKLLEQFGATLVEGDVTRADGLDAAVADVDVVFHLAGLITALSRDEMTQANATGASRIAEACGQRETPPVLVVLSSVAAAGSTARNTIRTESDPPQPVSMYGETKRAGELALAEWADRIPMTIIRPGIVFGPRDRLVLPIFKTIATWGIHPMVGRGSTKLALLFVTDLIDLLLKAAVDGERCLGERGEHQAGQGCYFAADEEMPSYREFGMQIARAMGRRELAFPVPPMGVKAAAAGNELICKVFRRRGAFTVDKVNEGRQPSWAISSAKARRQLDWRPQATLDQRIQQTVDWYRDRGWIRA